MRQVGVGHVTNSNLLAKCIKTRYITCILIFTCQIRLTTPQQMSDSLDLLIFSQLVHALQSDNFQGLLNSIPRHFGFPNINLPWHLIDGLKSDLKCFRITFEDAVEKLKEYCYDSFKEYSFDYNFLLKSLLIGACLWLSFRILRQVLLKIIDCFSNSKKEKEEAGPLLLTYGPIQRDVEVDRCIIAASKELSDLGITFFLSFSLFYYFHFDFFWFGTF